MPAHLRPLDEGCNAQGCDKRATVGLYNTFNALVGKFCSKHGQKRLAELEQKREEAPT